VQEVAKNSYDPLTGFTPWVSTFTAPYHAQFHYFKASKCYNSDSMQSMDVFKIIFQGFSMLFWFFQGSNYLWK